MTDSPLQIGPFELAEPIGEGGMGSVFRATHARTGVDVALKVVRADGGDEFRRQFHREVQAHAGLVHPGIVYLFDYGEIDEEAAEATGDELTAGSPWVAMELADRGTVRDSLPLNSWQEVRDVLVQTLDALAYSHAREVVHRDLKPENLLVFDGEAGPRVKLADFGIAHAFDDVEDRDTEQLQSTAGTPLYMAPEQIRGRWRSYGPWTDLYALGCITYQLVCGRPPFVADNPVTLTVHHCNEERPELAPRIPVPDGLEDWIRTAMAVDPADRFRRAADAAGALPVGEDLGEAVSVDADDLETMETVGETRPLTTTLAETEILPELAQTESAETTTESSPSGGSGPEPTGEGSMGAVDQPPESSSPSGGSGPEPTGEGSMGAVEQPRGSLPGWRRPTTDDVPTPMVGTGLGLFGLRESPFVDRNDERDLIWHHLREVISGDSARLVLIGGESGSGKSRLAQWVARRAHELGSTTVLRAVHTIAGPSRNEGFADLVRRAVHAWHLDRGELYEYLLERLPELPGDTDLVEADARALTEIVYPTDRNQTEVQGPRYEFGTPRQKHVVMTRLVGRLTVRRSTLVWLDDLQWGSPTLGWLEFLADEPDLEAVVVATYRTDIVDDDADLADRIDALEDREPVRLLNLDPLGSDDHREFIERLLPLSDRLADRIEETTDGNPLFARQLLADFVNNDELVMSDRGFDIPDEAVVEFPSDFHQLWQWRLERFIRDRFPDRAGQIRYLLELTAVLGRQVDTDEFRRVCKSCGFSAPDELVDRMIEARLADHYEGGWTFGHGMIVDSLRRIAQQEGRLADHHRRCARMVEHWYPDHPRRTARRRANHWVAAGEYERALEPLFDAAERQFSLGDHRRRQSILERRAELIEQLGLDETARARLENRVALLRTAAARRQIESSVSRLKELANRCRQSGNPDLAAQCLEILGHKLSDDRRQAHTYYDQALAEAHGADADQVHGSVRLTRGWLALSEGELETSLQDARRVLELVDEATFLGLRAHNLLGWVVMSRGDYRRAKKLFDKLHQMAKAEGFRKLEAQANNGLGDIARFQDEPDQARRTYRRVLDLGLEMDSDDLRVTGLVNLAQTELLAARFDRVDEYLDVLDDRSQVISAFHHSHLDDLGLALAAGRNNWTEFNEQFQAYEGGWPNPDQLIRDRPWLLERAADFCLEADKTGRATDCLEIACEMWNQLDDDEAFELAERRLDGLEGE